MLIPEVATPGPGKCLLHNIDGRLFIERADPVVLVAPSIIEQAWARRHPDMHLEGDVLTFDGQNQRVSYRLEAPDATGYRLARLT